MCRAPPCGPTATFFVPQVEEANAAAMMALVFAFLVVAWVCLQLHNIMMKFVHKHTNSQSGPTGLERKQMGKVGINDFSRTARAKPKQFLPVLLKPDKVGAAEHFQWDAIQFEEAEKKEQQQKVGGGVDKHGREQLLLVVLKWCSCSMCGSINIVIGEGAILR